MCLPVGWGGDLLSIFLVILIYEFYKFEFSREGVSVFFAQNLDVKTITQLDKASASGQQVLSSNYVWVLTFTFASNNISSSGANIINVARIESQHLFCYTSLKKNQKRI